jgi:hypothetical protein
MFEDLAARGGNTSSCGMRSTGSRKRRQEVIPVGAGLLNQVRQIAQACAAPWLLD